MIVNDEARNRIISQFMLARVCIGINYRFNRSLSDTLRAEGYIHASPKEEPVVFISHTVFFWIAKYGTRMKCWGYEATGEGPNDSDWRLGPRRPGEGRGLGEQKCAGLTAQRERAA